MVILVIIVCCGLQAGAQDYEYTSTKWASSSWEYEEEPVNELCGYLYIGFPGEGDFDLYKNAYGVEAQYRNWSWDPFGVALSLGYIHAEADPDSDGILPDNQGAFEGHISQVPVGPSVLYQVLFEEQWGLTFEVGLRYVFISSSMDYEWNDGRTDEVDLDHGLIALATLEGDYALGDMWRLFGGFGLQQDLAKGDMSIAEEDLRKNELKGFYLRLGARVLF
jgi:hypothetical protein